MEPIRHTLTARLNYLKLYREDVDQLLAIFARGCEKVIISDSKFRYDSLEEMKDKAGPRVKDLDIRGENPGVRFLFNQTEITKIGSSPTQVVYNELRTEEITDPAPHWNLRVHRCRPRFRRLCAAKGIETPVSVEVPVPAVIEPTMFDISPR